MCILCQGRCMLSEINANCCQSLSPVWLSVTPWISMDFPVLPGFPVVHCLPEFAQTHAIESVTPSKHLVLCRHILLLPPIFPSVRAFSNESALRIRWPKYWSFIFSISPSNEGLISFRIDWFDLLAVWRDSCILQHHSIENINSSVLSLLCGPTVTAVLEKP